jgi:beta-barrel assembly-enhancing protease
VLPKRLAAITCVAALLVAGCATRRPGDPISPGFNLYSKDQDIQLGKQLAQQVRQSLDVVNDQNLQNYVRTLGQKLASTPSAGDFPYEFTLINDPSINAFALPGGPIFLHSGLIQNADNEGQVAGVVAHEIAHVQLRHGTNQASRANLLEIPAVLAGAVLGQGAGAQIGQLGLSLGLQSVLLKYSRDAERQADALGARMMTEPGFNPIEMARFFEKLEAAGGSRAPEFLSSHPSPGNRVQLVQQEIQALPQGQYTAGTGRFDEVKRAVAQLPAPRRPQQQAVRQAAPGPPPSAPTGGGFQRMDGRNFSVGYPSETATPPVSPLPRGRDWCRPRQACRSGMGPCWGTTSRAAGRTCKAPRGK